MDCDLLVISASNGENLKLAERFAKSGRERGLRAAVADLTALDLPLFTPRTQALGLPPDISPLSQKLAAAPRWVICAPEYNGGIPPVLTNAIAWLSVQGDDFRSLFNSRPVVIATHCGGTGNGVLTALPAAATLDRTEFSRRSTDLRPTGLLDWPLLDTPGGAWGPGHQQARSALASPAPGS